MKDGVTLKELAKITQSQLQGDPDYTITGVNALESASSSDASFLANMRYSEMAQASKAGVICVAKSDNLPLSKNLLISDDPSRTFQQIAEHLIQGQKSAFAGIHKTAIVHESASIGENVTVGPYCVIDQNVTIGKNTTLSPHVSIGPGVSIGQDCLIHSNVTVRERCIIKDRVIIQPGAVIGSCGYGYTMTPEGNHKKLDQIGNVILEDDVEVGANTTIDRARFASTIIGKGTKLDNLVQIGHNVELGEDNLIISQSGIAGSAKTGRHVFMGGQAGIVGHVTITDNVQIATRGGVSKNIEQSGIYGGGPSMPMKAFNEMQVHMRKLSSYAKKLRTLEQQLASLEDEN